jgi:hypothetical protein
MKKRKLSVTAACLTLLPLAISLEWSVGQAQSSSDKANPGQSERVPRGQTSSPVVIDATATTVTPLPLPFPVGGKSPAGRVLSANSRYLTLDSKPWFPVMGECQEGHIGTHRVVLSANKVITEVFSFV